MEARHSGRRLILPPGQELPPVSELRGDERLALYAKEYHNTGRIVLPDGMIVKVDPPIQEIMRDMNSLSIITKVDSCAGGKREIVKLPAGYYWGATFAFIYDDNPEQLNSAVGFEKDLTSLRAVTEGITGRVINIHPPKQEGYAPEKAVKAGRNEYALVFDKKPSLTALDATWQAVHGIVKTRMKKG